MLLIKSLLNFQHYLLAGIAVTLRSWFLPLLARFSFAAILLAYYWASALTKVDFETMSLTTGAYAQIFPQASAAVGYDVSQLGFFHSFVVVLGTLAEFALPAMIFVGFMTRLAALGMIGFVLVQSITDIFGHQVDASTIGALFDRFPDAVILDQRLLWVTILMVIFVKGAGSLSLDHLFGLDKEDIHL